jgi:hypothetical protein
MCDPYEEDPDNVGDKRFKSEGRRAATGTKASCMDIFTLCIFPAGIALLVTMFVVFTLFGVLGYVRRCTAFDYKCNTHRLTACMLSFP